MNSIKNRYSPSGMSFSMHGARLTSLTDCPACKYGTIDKLHKQKVYACADCGRSWSHDEFEKLFPSKKKN